LQRADPLPSPIPVHIQGTFSAHSVNIQCTFSEHSVNIHGQLQHFPEHLFRSVQTPYRRPSLCTFGERSVHIQGTFSAHSGNIQCTFSEHSVNIHGQLLHFPEHLFRSVQTPYCRPSLCTFRERSVHIQGTFSAHSGNFQCTFRERSVHIQ